MSHTKELASDDFRQWLLRGELKKETEGMITAAQDQVLRTRYIQRMIGGNNISSICMNCNTKNKTINHIASECPALAENQYQKRHDSVAKALHWSLCKKHQLSCSDKRYEHQPEGVIQNDQAKTLWDYGIGTDRVLRAIRPDVKLIDKIKKKVSLIDVAIPWHPKVEEKEREKIDKYQDLKIETTRIWDIPVETVPIIIGTLSTILRSLKRKQGKLEAGVAPGIMQKIVGQIGSIFHKNLSLDDTSTKFGTNDVQDLLFKKRCASTGESPGRRTDRTESKWLG
ncbi:uncharacterized protein [Palaemon carinicauda]|uniref:uncharacterized protein n=1 Tax=Palaemon carinicauda TaxID=392227 RepID=UPI0035B58E54